ncbi:hypothetical protein COCSADRAFT_30109 [Bipolaris sorokiniana ND90Pr]|uniref:Uncharacterized protein n=1 Tax=Cochliobolus sativus (strain ND90Pr / ATCC 201652) TaxID=665912 RepID=M2QYG9_COCSN|nr:uncharacterized protein COCSADRAFT_30109 [Bipolaris sorokiniana ND90Pr]EMD60074.1 hypothetical protein COCSADRAFT_30109 [Bipolaris sorokiniana ND90Pr]
MAPCPKAVLALVLWYMDCQAGQHGWLSCVLLAGYYVLLVICKYVGAIMSPRKKQCPMPGRGDSTVGPATTHDTGARAPKGKGARPRAHRNHGQHRRPQRAGYPLASDDLLRQAAPICAAAHRCSVPKQPARGWPCLS